MNRNYSYPVFLVAGLNKKTLLIFANNYVYTLVPFQGVEFSCGKMTDVLENPFNQLTCKSAVFVVIVLTGSYITTPLFV